MYVLYFNIINSISQRDSSIILLLIVPSSLPALINKNFILCRSQRVSFICIISCDSYQARPCGFLSVDYILYWNRIQADTLSTATTRRLDVLLTYGKRPRYLHYASFTQAFMSMNYANLHFRRLSKTTSETNYRFVVADDPSACFKTTPKMRVFTAFHTPHIERYLPMLSVFDKDQIKLLINLTFMVPRIVNVFLKFCVVLFSNFVLFYVLFVLCRSVYCLCVNVYCTTATGWQPNCS